MSELNSNRMAFFLEPLDPLLFRDARPFASADIATSQLPTPQTLAGMFKTAIHRKCKMDPSDWHGLMSAAPGTVKEKHRWIKQLRFSGPWLARSKQTTGAMPNEIEALFLPVPAHRVKLGKDINDQLELGSLKPLSNEKMEAIKRLGWTAPPDLKTKAPDFRPSWLTGETEPNSTDGFVTLDVMARILKGETIHESEVTRRNCLVEEEDRTGVGLDPDRLTSGKADKKEDGRRDDPGLLFTVRYLRFKERVGFYCEVSADQNMIAEDVKPSESLKKFAEEIIGSGNCLPFGGEGRRVRVHLVPPIKWPPPPTDEQLAQKGGRVCHVLITPFFGSPKQSPPWLPDQGLPRLQSAIIPSPLAVSGWSLAGDKSNDHTPRPKPTRYAVPAGAVYFGIVGKSHINGHPDPVVLCSQPQYARQGWGLALRGVWDECNEI